MKKLNIKKQIRLLYLHEGIICFRVIDVIWVLFLLGRGFTLTQVGIAEGVFHLTSMLCEIPSGMAADLFGRKRTLILAGIMWMASSIFMGFGSWQGFIYVGMMFSALGNNLVSGTQEAMMYDSLLEAEKTEDYKKSRSAISMIGRSSQAVSFLLSPAAVSMGYRKTYLLTAIMALAGALAAFMMTEPQVTDRQKKRQRHPFSQMGKRWKEHIGETVFFIKNHPRTMCKLAADAAISCPCYLTMMYLQDHLINCGWPKSWIGIPMVVIPLAAALGSWLAARVNVGLFRTIMICGVCGGIGTCLAGENLLFVVIFGAVMNHICQGYAEIAVAESVNGEFESDQRATMISVDSMLYSIFMVAASPFTGYLGNRYSIRVLFLILGGILISMTLICGGAYRKITGKRN